ncbi:MAG: superinfection immunity protein [Candidatus Binatus sp.]
MQGSDPGTLIATLLVLTAAIAVYFLPALVAANRRHQNAQAIAILNLLLGWTFVGWVIALVWAFTAVQYPGQMPPNWSAEHDRARGRETPSRW